MIKSIKMRRTEHVTRIEEIRNECIIVFENPERKRLVWKPKCIWEDNIKMNLKGVVCNDVDKIHVVQDRGQR
jgi:hypothetical protein